jgi:hypothetical protein
MLDRNDLTWYAFYNRGLLTVAKFIYLLYTILIFFDPLTFSRLFERSRPKKRGKDALVPKT